MASLISFSSLPKPKHVRCSIAAPQTQTIIEGLEAKFGRKGIKFSESNNVPMVELKVRNGSSLKLSLSDAHVTSYKPKVYWKDDGFEEVLYTVEGNNESKGGVGVVIVNGEETNGSKGKSSVLSGCNWSVKDTDSDAIDALQIELSCTAGFLDINYIISLYPVSMATALVVTNNGRKPVTFQPGIMSYVRFKKRSGAGIQGLKGCSYCPNPPLSSPFELLSPSEAMKADSSGWFGSEEGEKPGIWTVEDSVITLLEKKMSRIYGAPPAERLKAVYNTPPSKYETIDQGRGLFFRMIRIGFEEMYVGSPGSMCDKFGKQNYFACTGPVSMLVPVDVAAGESWRGAMVIEHDNLKSTQTKPMATKCLSSVALPLMMVFAFILLPMISVALPKPESPNDYFKCNFGRCSSTAQCNGACLLMKFVHGGVCLKDPFFPTKFYCCCRLNNELPNAPMSNPIIAN